MMLVLVFVLISSLEAKMKIDVSSVYYRKSLENREQTNLDSKNNLNGITANHTQTNCSPINERSKNTEDLVNLKPRIFKRSKGIYTKVGDRKKDIPVGFLSPRDEIIYKEKYRKGDRVSDDKNSVPNQNTSRMYYDFESTLEQNLVRSHLIFPKKKGKSDIISNVVNPLEPVNLEEFEENSFMLKQMAPNSPIKKENTTSCDEFAKKALFHPNDIVNINWIPFYMWAHHGPNVATIHRFIYPTRSMVQHYIENYGRFVTNINWKQPKLLMINEKRMLLVAGDRKGLFYGIPDVDLPSSIMRSNFSVPVPTLRMKIVDPYLALMYCEEKFTMLMSILGKEPLTEEERVQEAAIMGIKENGRPMFPKVVTDEDRRSSLIEKQTQERNKLVRAELEHFNAASLITMM